MSAKNGSSGKNKLKEYRICPITGAICEKERCAWYYRVDSVHGMCAILLIAMKLSRMG